MTLRRWTKQNKIPSIRVGNEHRYRQTDLDQYMGTGQARPRQEAHYVRVSGATGQETSIETQTQQLADSATGPIHKVYRDRASGLKEDRPGLTRLLQDVTHGKITTVRVTHRDRLTRFGVTWIEQLLARDGVILEILYDKAPTGGMPELIQDFVDLVAVFAGRIYGMRSRENRQRLLDQTAKQISDG